MAWDDNDLINIWCPVCDGVGSLPNKDGNSGRTTCKTCKGYRLVRISERKLNIYDPDDDNVK